MAGANMMMGAGSSSPSGIGLSKGVGFISRALQGISSPAAPQQVPTSGAMARRTESIDNSPIKQLSRSIEMAKNIPDAQQRQDILYPLMKADYVARAKGGF